MTEPSTGIELPITFANPPFAVKDVLCKSPGTASYLYNIGCRPRGPVTLLYRYYKTRESRASPPDIHIRFLKVYNRLIQQ